MLTFPNSAISAALGVSATWIGSQLEKQGTKLVGTKHGYFFRPCFILKMNK